MEPKTYVRIELESINISCLHIYIYMSVLIDSDKELFCGLPKLDINESSDIDVGPLRGFLVDLSHPNE